MSKKNRRQVSFRFSEGSAKSLTAEVRGGKGMGLADLAALGLPIPSGFTLSTTVSRAFLEHGRLPNRVEGQLERYMAQLEKDTGKEFGNADNPLFVSVRSGAPVSMPGMMDTILNVGASMGELRTSIEAVCESWNSERAVAYRKAHGISELLGTAINIQAMVFGNKDAESGTGVVFSRNIITGQRELYGEFLVQAQGDELVSGTRTPEPIATMEGWNPEVFAELIGYTRQLDDHYGYPVEIEFTVESGKLWLLQVRRAKLTARAAATVAVHDVWEKKVDRLSAIKRLSADELERLSRREFDPKAVEDYKALKSYLVGLPASPGAAVGRPVFSSDEAVRRAALGESVILIREDTSPNDLPGMLVSKAIVTSTGGVTSHAAVVAVSLGIPAVVGIAGMFHCAPTNATISVDGTAGHMYFGEIPMVGQQASTKELALFTRWVEESGLHRAKAKIDFSAIHQVVSVNDMLRNFYLLAAMAREAVGTPLEDRARQIQINVHTAQAEFMACYLLLAVAGELRHAFNRVKSDSPTSLLVKSLATKFGTVIGTSSDDRLASQEGLLAKIQEQGSENQKLQFVQEFLATAVEIFSDSTIWTGSYGGPKWAAIAEAPLHYLRGQFSHTVFVDHAFDLRHNGRVMFNKHMMVSARTDELSLKRELEIKKRATTAAQLFSQLVSDVDHLRTDVWSLWKDGWRQGLWKYGTLSGRVLHIPTTEEWWKEGYE